MAVKKKKGRELAVKTFRAQPYDPNITFQDGIPVPDVLIDMVDAYQLHPFVYSAVNIIATNFAQVMYEFWFKNSEGEWVVDEEHPFRRLLELPNPYQSGYDLRELSAISLEMTGNCYWSLERDKRTNEPNEIWLLPSHMVKVVSDSSTPFSKYIYTVDGKDIVYQYEDIIHFQYSNPKSMVYGQGSILASREDITSDIYASIWNKNFFKNSARPDSILETDKVLDDNVRKRMISSWKSMHEGYKNAHRTALLEQGVKYKEVHQNHKDMDFIVQRKLARETIYGVFGVPPAVAGVLENANYSNMKEQNKIFWQYTMLPKLRKFESTLTNRLRNISYRQKSVVQAKLENVEALRQDLQQLAITAKTYCDMGIPLNDVIEKLDLPFEEVEGGDVPNPSVRPPAPVEPVEPAEKPEEAEKSIKDKTFEKKILRQMKWKSYESELMKWESYFKGIMKSFFKAQRRRVLANLREVVQKDFCSREKKPVGTISVEMLFDQKKEQKILEGTIQRPIKKIAVEFANRTAKLVGEDLNFDFVDAKAIAWLSDKTMKVSQNVNTFTMESISNEVKEAVEDAVREGWTEGESIEQIVDRIENVYDFAVEGRAERIAVTESASASNWGNAEAMKETGVLNKEWLSTNDSHTRDSHVALDGQVRGVGEMFETINGNKLLYPADTDNAPPEETVNCRCTILPVIEDEG